MIDAGVDAGVAMESADAGPAKGWSDDMEAAIVKLAETHAPHMTSEGGAGAKNGSAASAKVTLDPGRCYSAIGVSPAGQATEVKVSLTGNGTKATMTSKPAKSGEPTSVVLLEGKSALCVTKKTDNLSYNLAIEATKGSGALYVKLFGRPATK